MGWGQNIKGAIDWLKGLKDPLTRGNLVESLKSAGYTREMIKGVSDFYAKNFEKQGAQQFLARSQGLLMILDSFVATRVPIIILPPGTLETICRQAGNCTSPPIA